MKRMIMKKKLLWSSTAWVLFIMLCLVGQASASQIPFGLDWRESIFVQEYWTDGKPQFCIATLTDQDIRLQVSRWHPGEPVEPLEVMSFSANTVKCMDAQPFLDKRYLEFQVLKGPRLGLLRPLALPPAGNEAKKVGVASYQNLNGSCRNSEITVEQEKLWFRSGEHVSLTLTPPAIKGKIIIKKESENKYLNDIWPDRILSSSLPIETKEDQIIIDSDRPLIKQAVHSIQWNFVAPTVETPTMFKISAQIKLAGQNWNCFVRAVLIKP